MSVNFMLVWIKQNDLETLEVKITIEWLRKGITMRYMNLFIIFITVTVFMKYLTESSKKRAENNNGIMVLKMNKAYGIVGYISMFAAVIIGVIASLGTVKDIIDLALVFGLFTIFFGIGILLVLSSRNKKIEVSEEEINSYSITGKVTKILWEDISNVSFSNISLELKLTAGRKNIKLHLHNVGFYDFIKLIETKLSCELYMTALMSLEAADKNLRKKYN